MAPPTSLASPSPTRPSKTPFCPELCSWKLTLAASTFRVPFFPVRTAPVARLHARCSAPNIPRIGALLPNADFRHAHVDGSSFRGARITDAVFSWSHLNATDFTDAVGVGKALWTGFRGTPVGLPPGLQSLWR
mmetsp:Transcript_22815/g.71638  ORF Transcript_22815/g.71638 Transcript_22815/m.71638 type:complete len:133 (+) Transcript_22815:1388-1786(+)